MTHRGERIGGGAAMASALLLGLLALSFLSFFSGGVVAVPPTVHEAGVPADASDGGAAFFCAQVHAPMDRLVPIDPEDEVHVRQRFGTGVHLSFPLSANLRTSLHQPDATAFAARAPPLRF